MAADDQARTWRGRFIYVEAPWCDWLQSPRQRTVPPVLPRSALKKPSKRPSLKKLLRKAHAKPLKQVAALPFRISPEGRLEVLLITSRDTGRWIIPKGWPMVGCKAHQAAEREAFEEAGLKGQIRTKALGKYHYEKCFDNGVAFPCEVRVYALRVDGQHERWPEQSQRALHWFAPAEAARLVQEDELAHLIEGFAAALIGGD